MDTGRIFAATCSVQYSAYLRLQDGSEPVETIARAVGFGDPERMRRAFVTRYGQPPQSIRRMARGSDIEAVNGST